jgi:hypothetical protein
MKFKNIGKMHTPVKQPIKLYLKNTNWVEFDEKDTQDIQ